MNLKSKLANQAKKSLAVSHKETALVSQKNEIDKITQNIRSDLMEMEEIQEFVLQKRSRYAELRENIVKNLIYVRDNKKTLLSVSFEQYLESEIGITKGYFYEQVQAYELCQIYEKPELFRQVDYKILVMIARIKNTEEQKQLINQAKDLSRESFKNLKAVEWKNSTIYIKQVNPKKIQIEFNKSVSAEQQQKIIEMILKETEY